jgi:hypothetical protein
MVYYLLCQRTFLNFLFFEITRTGKFSLIINELVTIFCALLRMCAILFLIVFGGAAMHCGSTVNYLKYPPVPTIVGRTGYSPKIKKMANGIFCWGLNLAESFTVANTRHGEASL